MPNPWDLYSGTGLFGNIPGQNLPVPYTPPASDYNAYGGIGVPTVLTLFNKYFKDYNVVNKRKPDLGELQGRFAEFFRIGTPNDSTAWLKQWATYYGINYNDARNFFKKNAKEFAQVIYNTVPNSGMLFGYARSVQGFDFGSDNTKYIRMFIPGFGGIWVSLKEALPFAPSPQEVIDKVHAAQNVLLSTIGNGIDAVASGIGGEVGNFLKTVFKPLVPWLLGAVGLFITYRFIKRKRKK